MDRMATRARSAAGYRHMTRCSHRRIEAPSPVVQGRRRSARRPSPRRRKGDSSAASAPLDWCRREPQRWGH
eukprot:823830-Pleurochrysis_carterae.AAC.1